MMTITFSEAFQRTEAGRAEVKAHKLQMARPARNLLMVIDGSCSGRDWLRKVNGTGEADLALLIEAGLIAPVTVAPTARTMMPVADAPGGAAAARSGPTLEEALARWPFDGLYTLLTHEARERFGLIKGYRLILEIERCSGPDEMRGMAMKFIEQLRNAHGEETAQRFARQIITTAPATKG